MVSGNRLQKLCTSVEVVQRSLDLPEDHLYLQYLFGSFTQMTVHTEFSQGEKEEHCLGLFVFTGLFCLLCLQSSLFYVLL